LGAKPLAWILVMAIASPNLLKNLKICFVLYSNHIFRKF
jgi:hypothetical protein